MIVVCAVEHIQVLELQTRWTNKKYVVIMLK